MLRGGDSPVTVELDGGELMVDVDESLHVDLTGWAVPVFRGELALTRSMTAALGAERLADGVAADGLASLDVLEPDARALGPRRAIGPGTDRVGAGASAPTRARGVQRGRR